MVLCKILVKYKKVLFIQRIVKFFQLEMLVYHWCLYLNETDFYYKKWKRFLLNTKINIILEEVLHDLKRRAYNQKSEVKFESQKNYSSFVKN
jgi:hypothetical protein